MVTGVVKVSSCLLCYTGGIVLYTLKSPRTRNGTVVDHLHGAVWSSTRLFNLRSLIPSQEMNQSKV